MKKKLLYFFVILLALGLAFGYDQLQPAGDINDYKAYFVNDKTRPNNGSIKATFFGVSTILLDDGQTQLLIDGYFTRPAMLPLLTAKVQSDTALIDKYVTDFQMNRVKGLFVTHSHFDHALDAAYVTRKTGATLYGSISTLNIGHGGGVPDKQLALFQENQAFRIGKFTVKVIKSKHSDPNSLADDGVIIQKPLPQPAKMKAYAEGGSYDFYITHNGHSIYIKPSANYIAGVLDSLKADVVMMGISTLNKHDEAWRTAFYDQTIGKLKPKTFVPLHWDDFFKPLSENLVILPKFAGNTPADFDYMIQKTKADGIDFKVLQGTKSVTLF